MSTEADGTINIDLVLNKDKFTPDLESAKALIQNFGSNAGDQMDSSFSENASKVSNKAKETHEKVKSDLGDKVTQKIDADDNQAKEVIKRIKSEEESLKKPVEVRIKANFSELNQSIGSAKNKFTPDLESAKLLIQDFGSNAGNKMNISFSENASKVLSKAKEAHEKVKADLDKKVTQKIDADDKQTEEAIKRIKHEEEALKKPVTVRIKANFSEFKHNVGSAMDKIRDLRDQSVKVKGAFSGAFGGAFLGNLASNAWGTITSHINEAKDAIVEYNNKQQVMNATWKTLTGSAKDGRAMVDMVNDMSTSLGQDVDVTDELAQQFYHVYDNKPQTEKLTKSFLTMGDAIGMSGDRLKQVGLDFTHTMSSGIMQLGDFNQMTDAFPMYGKALLDYEKKLQHNSSLTMSQLRKQMSDGKISAQDAAAVFNSLGDKYKDSAENLMQTLPGMTRKLKSQIPKLFNDMVSPILNARNPIFEQVSKWSSDPKTETAFQKLGTKVSGGMTKVMKAFGSQAGNKSLSDILDGLIGKIGNGLASSLDWISKHAKAITEIFKGIGSIGSNLTIGFIDGLTGMFKGLTHAKGDGVNAIADGISRIAKHKTAIQVIGAVLAGMWAVSKVTNYILKVQSLIKVLGALKKVALGSTVAQGAEGAEAGGAGLLGKIGSSSKLGNALAIGKSIGGKLVAGLTIALDAFDIYKGLTSKSRNYKFTETGKGIGGLIGAGIGFAFLGPTGAVIGSILGNLAGKWAGIATLKFSNGWNDWAKGYKPKGIIAKIGFNTHEAINNWNNIIAKMERNHPIISFGIRVTKGSIVSEFSLIKDMFKVYFGIKSSIWDILSDAITGRFDKIFPDLKKRWTGLFKSFADDINNIKNAFTSDNSETRRGQSNTHASKGAVSSLSDPMRGNGAGNGFNPNINLGTVPRRRSSAPRVSAPKRNQGASTERTIKKVATERTVTSKDVANVKAMAKAIGTYDRAIKTLKKDVRHFPALKIGNSAKQIRKQISSIKKYDGQIKRSERTMKKYSKTFSGVNKSLRSITRQFTLLEKFNKSFGKKDAFSKLNSDLKTLHKTLRKNDIVKDFKKLNTGLKKNNPSKVIDKINREIKKSIPIWRKFARQVNIVSRAFKTLNTFSSRMSKTDPFRKLNTDLMRLSRTLKKYDFGKMLQKEVNEANNATKRAKFANQFDSQVTKIIRKLSSFRRTFIRDWGNVWTKAESEEKSKTSRLDPTFSNETNKILSTESKFSSKFLNTWSSWLNSMTKSFKSAFDSLPGMASREMSKVIAQINKGIGSVNTVIGAFGGKKLGLAKYATGTSGTGGGLAVVGEQGYELAYDKRHGIYPVGTKGEEIRYLDRDTSIMPHDMSNQFMSMVAGLPHHASGKGDAKGDMMDYLITHLDKIKKNPMPLLTKTFNKKAKFSGSEFERKFGPALEKGFLKAISEPFKKELADMDFSMGGNYDPKMIKAAAAMMKVNPSDSFIKMLQSVIQSESGGRNVIQQIHDQNSGGNEARGILQYTPPTFGYYAVPGHKNIMNPFDQLLAFFNNSDWQSSIGPTSIWGHAKIDWLHSGPQGRPRFGNGGWSDKEAIFGEIPGEPEVAINPNRNSADRLIMEAIQKRVEKNPNGILARTIRTIHNSRNQAYEFAGKSIANNNAAVASGNIGINSKSLGNITVNTLLDNGVIVQGTYPLIKAMQAKEINLQAKKGGLH